MDAFQRALQDRETLMALAKQQPPITEEEMAGLVQSGSPLFRFAGMLLRRHEEATKTSFQHADLISEEGRLRAIKDQGIVHGRSLFLDEVFDLIMEGSQDDHGTQ